MEISIDDKIHYEIFGNVSYLDILLQFNKNDTLLIENFNKEHLAILEKNKLIVKKDNYICFNTKFVPKNNINLFLPVANPLKNKTKLNKTVSINREYITQAKIVKYTKQHKSIEINELFSLCKDNINHFILDNNYFNTTINKLIELEYIDQKENNILYVA